MEHTAPAVGYYKVWTTDARVQPDRDTYRGPERLRLRPEDAITQWIFTFTRETHDATRARAFTRAAKLCDELGLPAGCAQFAPTEDLDIYSIRVDANVKARRS